ncbi:FAD/NAD(P)-binding domain-containing protein [Hysterangium stoloniferum]|nr:FAD/NAD(P)-binding domain-containing protein [Hysterangium stoloniferum]
MSLLVKTSIAALARHRAVAVSTRLSSTAVPQRPKILVVGGGTGGLTAANQIYNRFAKAGKSLGEGDVVILDSAHYHYYQPGWTLVGGGLKDKSSQQLRRRLADIVPDHITLIPENVVSFSPKTSSVTTTSGNSISYDVLVVAAGIQINWDSINGGLRRALADPSSGVSSIYSYETCDKTWNDIESMRTGKAIFTQPAGPVKCAGAPQKIMWMAWDRYRQTNRGNNVKCEFWTGMPTMFSVPKYSEILNALRIERGIRGEFGHNLVSIDSTERIATFKKADGSTVQTDYSLLHVTPPMGPPTFIKDSPIADAAGWVDVNDATLQHKNPDYSNIFALGDCSSLPTSKTAAAITAQAPIVAENVFTFLDSGKVSGAAYDGYTSCPLITSYDALLLAEFTYGAKPKETFNKWFGIDQGKPRRVFFEMKRSLFSWVYFQYFVTGKWYGPHGFRRPDL